MCYVAKAELYLKNPSVLAAFSSAGITGGATMSAYLVCLIKRRP